MSLRATADSRFLNCHNCLVHLIMLTPSHHHKLLFLCLSKVLHSSCFIYQIYMWFLLLLSIIINIRISLQRHTICFCRRLLVHVFKGRSWWTNVNALIIFLVIYLQILLTLNWTCLIRVHSCVNILIFCINFFFDNVMNISTFSLLL